jgi:hypothetical protein
MPMMWEKPRFLEVAMNAEIGAYQDDSDSGNIPVVERDLDDSDELSKHRAA